ncbi:tetratricopeptide repeat protein [Pinirhizobacter sp.]|jgi:Flp pilus assembly protein TadD|uniref:tetratricopeptide repeat protein n=1 Tax=Pinirhizobacter sp. TaxID=2950432 RepID=UPI002F3FDE56
MARILIGFGFVLASMAMLGGCASGPTASSPKPAGPGQLSQVLSLEKQAAEDYQAHRDAQAAGDYGKLVKLVPDDPNYWYMLGNAYVRSGQPELAVRSYNQSIMRDPNNAHAWHNLGVIRLRQARAAFTSSARLARAGDSVQASSQRIANALTTINQVPKQTAPVEGPAIDDSSATPTTSPAAPTARAKEPVIITQPTKSP